MLADDLATGYSSVATEFNMFHFLFFIFESTKFALKLGIMQKGRLWAATDYTGKPANDEQAVSELSHALKVRLNILTSAHSNVVSPLFSITLLQI